MNILRKIFTLQPALAIGLIAGTLLIPAGVSAQATLQNTTSNLQPQAATDQKSANTQTQSGTLQNNSGSSLNQSATRPLGVVSSPNQAQPDTVVQPSDSLVAESSATEEPRNNGYLFGLFAGIVAVGAIGAYTRRSKKNAPTELVVEKPVVRPEPIKVPKKTRAKTTAKKKKSRKR